MGIKGEVVKRGIVVVGISRCRILLRINSSRCMEMTETGLEG
jgi:hypothetical protein